MPYTAITKPSVGDPTKKTAFADAVVDNLDYLNSQLTYTTGGTRILNGSFEQDTDADGVPDGWAKTLFTGGSSTHDTTDQDLGAAGRAHHAAERCHVWEAPPRRLR